MIILSGLEVLTCFIVDAGILDLLFLLRNIVCAISFVLVGVIVGLKRFLFVELVFNEGAPKG